MKADAREASLDRREQALADRLSQAEATDAAAQHRDDISDARDLRSDNRDDALDRARSVQEGFSYDPDKPGSNAAALDRKHAKGDRLASQDDRAASTEDLGDPEAH